MTSTLAGLRAQLAERELCLAACSAANDDVLAAELAAQLEREIIVLRDVLGMMTAGLPPEA